MASPIATAPHSGPVDQPGEHAYFYARSGIARSATTRSNYVAPLVSIDWIVRDDAGNILWTQDITGVILLHTLHITQAINDEPDSCSFTLRPQSADGGFGAVFHVETGHEIRITWAPGGPPLFHGFIVTVQRDWRLGNAQADWTAVQCQDAMWRFDARIVTYRFPAQSVTASIAHLVTYFCNVAPTTTHPLDFDQSFVQAGMPSIPAFDVVNQRPSTVMRTLMAAVNGGFYVEGLAVHAWANSVSEPNQTNPITLTVDLPTLKRVRITEDATQIRRRVLVEGRRTSTLMGYPSMPSANGVEMGLPVSDATLFAPATGPTALYQARIGTQWTIVGHPITVHPQGANPPQTRTTAPYVVGTWVLDVEAMPVLPPPAGWIRISGQYARYGAYTGNPQTGPWRLILNSPDSLYGVLTVPIATGATVEWVDAVMRFEAAGTYRGSVAESGDPTIRTHPPDTPVVTFAHASTPHGTWPPLEGFVQDGRYSYAGAQARADDDLAAFRDPLVAAEWETDDHNAIPGRSQAIALYNFETFYEPINMTVTILRVELSFPLRTLPPLRACTGGIVKPSTFMDLVVTDNS